MSAVEKLLNIARDEIGYLEKKTNSQLDDKTANAGYNNYTKYARDLDMTDIYNGKKNGYAWCDVFVDWCFIQAFGFETAVKLTCQPTGGYGAGCTFSARYYKWKDQFHESDPQPGDQIFFTKDSGKTYYHTGIVESVKDGRVYTIEGNTSSKAGVVENGGSVERKSYALTYPRIGGYGRPDYSLVENSVTPEPTEPTDDTPDVAYDPAKVGTVTASHSLLIRDSASENAKTLSSLKNGAEVSILGADSSGDWYKLSSGWVKAEFVHLDSANTNTVTKITTGVLNIRSGRGNGYAIVTKMPKNTSITVSDLKDNWYYMEYNDKAGYCSAKYLTDPIDLSDTSVIYDSPKAGTVTASHSLLIREKASVSSKTLSSLKNGAKALVYGANAKGDWYRLATGWVKAEFVHLDSANANATTKKTTTTLNMRSGRGTGYAIVTRIPKGTSVKVSDKKGNWCYVEYNGKAGYSNANYFI